MTTWPKITIIFFFHFPGKNTSGIKTVGFRIGSYIEGSIVVESVENLPHIPNQMKLAAKVLNNCFYSA